MPPILSDDTGSLRPAVVNPPAILVIALLWLTFALAFPFYQLRQARRQARQDLLHLLATEKPDPGGLVAAFDRSNQNLDAAASGPCFILAFTSILLVNQLLKLRRRYNALAHDLAAADQRQAGSD